MADSDASSHSLAETIRELYTDDSENELNENLLSRQRPKMSMMQRLRSSTTTAKPKITTTERIRGGGGEGAGVGASGAGSVMTAIAPVVSQIWFFPVVALLVTGVFTAVQVSNHLTKDEKPVVIPLGKDGESGGMSDPLRQRQGGGNNGFFSKAPSPAKLNGVMAPTTVVASHNEPKFPDLSPTMGPVSGIITIATKSKEISDPENAGTGAEIKYRVPVGTPTTVPWGLENGGINYKVPNGTPTTAPWYDMKKGSPTNMRWKIPKVPAGTPTTAPWLALQNGAPIDLNAMKVPAGTPTTAPWFDMMNGAPVNVRFKVPAGTPTTAPWGQLQAAPVNMWKVPAGTPTTSPWADLQGSPANTVWQIPEVPAGTPTTAPWGKIAASPVTLYDKVPKGQPTTAPFAKLKEGLPTKVELPDGVPTTSPWAAFNHSPVEIQKLTIPDGVPTTSPWQAFKSAPVDFKIWGETLSTAPIPRPVELGTSKPTQSPTNAPLTPTMPPTLPPVPLPLPPVPLPPPVAAPIPQVTPPVPETSQVTVSTPGSTQNIPVTGGQGSTIGMGIPTGGGGGSGGEGTGGGGGGGMDGGGTGGGGGMGGGGGGMGGEGGGMGGGGEDGGPKPQPRPPTTPGPTLAPCFYKPNLSVPTKGKSNQDDAIYEIYYTNPLKSCGTILEIGAGDGDTDSPSYFFDLALGWKSILIEANPVKYAAIARNRPNAVAINGAFCENEFIEFYGDSFHAVGGAFETISEVNVISARPKDESQISKVPCIQLQNVFKENSISHQGIDVIYIQVSGVVLSIIRAMDWTVRTSIWVIELRGDPKLDGKVREVLLQNQYVKAQWSIQRWCTQMGQCMKNEVYLKRGFNPLPVEQIRRRLSAYKKKKRENERLLN